MTNTITLTQKKILSMNVNIPERCIEVTYVLRDTSERDWDLKHLIFWETIPDPGTDPATGQAAPLPDNWKQLPTKYVAGLVEMHQDLSAFIDQYEQLI